MEIKSFFRAAFGWVGGQKTAPASRIANDGLKSPAARSESKRKHGFLSDTPFGQDYFGRGPFSRALAASLVLPAGSEGIVVGIEGAWGSGKSFVIHQVKSILNESSTAPIVVEFNPWVISGTESLIEALLEQLSSAIGTFADELPSSDKAVALEAGSSMLRYLRLVRHFRYLKYVPGATALGHFAEDLPDLAEKIGNAANEGSRDLSELAEKLPGHSLSSRKTDVTNALTKLDRPIVIVLDDLDRLPPDEIRSIFQAVKAVANFPRTAYLLSYDPRIAAKALDRREIVGLSYLEKIVQVQYPIPAPLPWRMRAFVVAKLRETILDSSLEMTSDEESRFGVTASYVARLCRHPRDVVRICNRLRISLPATKNEVDIADVMLLEALAVCDQRVDQAIRQWPEEFVGTTNLDFENFGEEYYFVHAAERVLESKSNAKSKEPEWRKRIAGPLSHFAEAATRLLFPEKHHPDGSLRVRNWDRLYRFLAIGPAELITEIGDLRTLVKDSSELRAALDTDDKSSLSILRSIELYADQLQIASSHDFCDALCASAKRRLTEGESEWGDLASQYADAMQAILQRDALRTSIIKHIVSIAPLSVSQKLLSEAASDLGLWRGAIDRKASENQRLIQDESDFLRILEVWRELIERMSTDAVDLQREPLVYRALYRLGVFGRDFAIARGIAKKLVETGDLKRFMISTGLASDVTASVTSLDLVWDGVGLLAILENDASSAHRYANAIEFLRRADVRDYFQRRTVKPTTKWPPDESKCEAIGTQA